VNVLLGQKRRCRPCDRRVRSHPNSGCAGRGAPTPVSCHNPTFRGCPSALRRGRGVILAPVPTRRSTTRSCSATLERGSWICNALSKARPRLRHCRWRIRPVRSTFAKRHRSFFPCPLSSAPDWRQPPSTHHLATGTAGASTDPFATLRLKTKRRRDPEIPALAGGLRGLKVAVGPEPVTTNATTLVPCLERSPGRHAWRPPWFEPPSHSARNRRQQ